MTDPATEASVRTGYRATFGVLAAGVLAFALLQSLVIPVLPTIQQALGTNQADVTWVLTAYLLSASIATPIVGRLGDSTGKKRMFVIALSALALGCLLAALATSLPVMIVARVIQGVGGGVLPLAFGIVRDEFPADRVPSAISVVASLASGGAGVGLVIAGPIVGLLGEDWLFWIPLVVLVAAAVAAHLVIPESASRTPGRINWVAAPLLSGWLVALLLAVSQAPRWGWASPAVLGLLAAAVVLTVTWVLVEARSAHPLIDMRMMRRRPVWTTNLVALLVGVALYAAFAFLPQFLQTPASEGYGFGASVTESGLMVLPQTAAAFLVGLFGGQLGQRFGSRQALLAGTIVSAVGYLLFATLHDQRWHVYPISAVIGVGFGLAFAATANLIVAAVPPEQTGVASGMNANIRTIGGAIGAAVMASVVTAGVGPGEVPREAGYTTGFLVLTGAMVLAAGAALLIPSIRRDPVTHAEPAVALRHPGAGLVAGGTVVGDDPE